MTSIVFSPASSANLVDGVFLSLATFDCRYARGDAVHAPLNATNTLAEVGDLGHHRHQFRRRRLGRMGDDDDLGAGRFRAFSRLTTSAARRTSPSWSPARASRTKSGL